MPRLSWLLVTVMLHFYQSWQRVEYSVLVSLREPLKGTHMLRHLRATGGSDLQAECEQLQGTLVAGAGILLLRAGQAELPCAEAHSLVEEVGLQGGACRQRR
jgi:hypothetical protein